MQPLNVSLVLDRIHCFDEGDGPGNAEPYLWTVFFKIDGDTAVVNPALSLEGHATVVGTPGNHGNLPNHDVDAGDDVAIPAQIGQFNTVLRPIPLKSPVGGVQNVGGAIGCIAVLMEEDNTPNSAIAKGHQALDKAVRSALDGLVPTLNLGHQEPSDAEIAAMQAKIGQAVQAAVKADVSVWDWLGGLGNMDDQIGSAVFQFSQKSLQDAGPAGIPFSRRWKNEGDWELYGHIQGTTGPSWSGWENLGGGLSSGPAVASWAAGRLDTFVRGGDNAMWHKWWDGHSWSGWENLGGVITSEPAAVSWGPNRIDTFARGVNRHLWHKWWDGHTWSGWEDLGGSLSSSPAVASWSSNRLDVFVRGDNDSMWHKWWDGHTWSGWEDLGGGLTSAPAAVSWGPNRIDTFVRGGDNAMWHKWWDGHSWSGWENLGGGLSSAPAAASWASGRIDTFVRGGDNAMWQQMVGRARLEWLGKPRRRVDIYSGGGFVGAEPDRYLCTRRRQCHVAQVVGVTPHVISPLVPGVCYAETGRVLIT